MASATQILTRIIISYGRPTSRINSKLPVYRPIHSTKDSRTIRFSNSTITGPLPTPAALVEFLGSAAVHSVTDPLTAAPPGTRGFFDLFDSLRWRAGMVAQLAVESALRKALRDKLVAALNEFQPDILAAHSLGTLITYDLFRNDPRGRDILANGVYITFGSQI